MLSYPMPGNEHVLLIIILKEQHVHDTASVLRDEGRSPSRLDVADDGGCVDLLIGAHVESYALR